MRAQKSGIDFVVLMGGVATSFAALVLLFLLGLFNIDPMSYYIVFIIPIGALAVGLAAGSGYALASWIRSVFVQRSTKIIIFALGAVTYILAHYITYRLTLAAEGVATDAFSFVDYIRMLCENIS